jgi:DNA-binding CsgD family transcriptional regulator
MTTQDERIRTEFASATKNAPGLWGCKNAELVFLCVNAEFSRLGGMRHEEDLVGRTDFDLRSPAVACAELFHQQDKEVVDTGRTLRILDIHPFLDGVWRAHLTTKMPVYNGNQEIAGTSFHCMELTELSSAVTIELGTLLGRIHSGDVRPDCLGQGSYRLDGGGMPIEPTAREMEVLFFLLRGQSAKRIAHIFRISERTVEQHLKALRHKFDCTTKNSLIEKAIYLGYLRVIPQRLLNRQLSMILRED